MIRINRKTDYAVRVLLMLARLPTGKRISTQEVQTEMQVPRAYLQRIIARLSRARLVATFPGPNGGIQLARAPELINLRHVWDAVEGPLLLSDCLKGSGNCSFEERCPVRTRWGRLQAIIIHELEATILSDLAAEADWIEFEDRAQSMIS